MSFPKVNIPSPYNPIYRGVGPYDQDLAKSIEQLISNLDNIFNSGLRIDESGDLQIISFTSNGVANTEDTVPHTLKRVPVGFFVIRQDKASIVYDGATAWTATDIYLKTNVATVALTIVVF